MQIHQALAELGLNVKRGTRHSSHVDGAKKVFSIHKSQFNAPVVELAVAA